MPVPLAVGLGLAAELAVAEAAAREARCRAFRAVAPRRPRAARPGHQRRPGALGVLHSQSVVSGPGRGDRDRLVARPGGDLERRRVHLAELHLQSRAERDAAARMEKGRRRCGFRGARPRRSPTGALWWPPSSAIAASKGSVSRERAARRDVYYRRSRFTTHLPIDRRYSAAHYWLLEESPGVWRVGFTKFATRMLGDIVEFEFSAAPGAAISVGDEIGSIEGLKAVTSVFSAGVGRFLGEGRAAQAGRHARRIGSLRPGLVV